MYIAIDVLLVATLAYCVWRGYRSGIIRGVCGSIALIAAIFAANLVAATYSNEVSVMLKPFVGGVVDNALTSLMDPSEEEGQTADGDLTQDGIAEDVLIPGNATNAQLRSASYAALRRIGMPESASALLAEKIAGGRFEQGVALSDVISDKLCDALAYIAVFGVVFLLGAIVSVVVGNVLNLVFKLPGLETMDSIVGMVFGLLKGIIVVYVISLVVRYIGLLAPSVIEKTTILKYLIGTNPLADILGI
ncbi:MAG: CvpA family protein [Oscillospiraceae bacterium]|nr:CvpA family protein [Oscillospiraceae bacterium]